MDRWRKFSYDEIIARNKTSLDIFFVKDTSLDDLDNLPDTENIASEIMKNLQMAMERFSSIMQNLSV